MADVAETEPFAVADVAGDALDPTGATESELDDELLAQFYAFTYEDAVLVGPSGSSPPHSPSRRNGGKDSPRKRPPSPTRSPTKHDTQQQVDALTGPTASLVGAPGELPLLSREILNAMLPPKTWRDESGKWQRVARLTPSSRTDVLRFEALFTQLLEEHQARASAICPVREKFFLQVFEELIRECACECPERGLLLLRLRDELRMSVEAYQTLYHNSIAYGRQKAVQAEAGIAELEDRVTELQREQQRLRARQQQLTHRLLHEEAEAAESKRARQRRQQQLVEFLRDQHAQLATFHSELTQDTTWK